MVLSFIARQLLSFGRKDGLENFADVNVMCHPPGFAGEQGVIKCFVGANHPTIKSYDENDVLYIRKFIFQQGCCH